MKNLILLLVILFLAAVTLPSQASVNRNRKSGEQHIQNMHENQNIHVVMAPDINSLSIDQFHTDFGKVKNENWRKTDHFDEVSFSKNNKEMTAYYNDEGNLIGTTVAKTFGELPREGQRQIKDEYPGYKIGPVIKFNDDNIDPGESSIYGSQYRFPENYFVELIKGNDRIIVQINPAGMIYYFRSLGSAIG